MIRLPKNFFANLSTNQYKEYLKLLPKLNDEKAQYYTMLAFTLAALSFFGIFAIKPTLSTIAELNRKLEDMQFVHNKYKIKSQSLSILQNAYSSLTGDLPIVVNAMPQKPEVPKLVAQINALLIRSNLNTKSLKTSSIEITPGKKTSGNKISSFTFTMEVTGDYNNMLSFIQDMTRANRLITIETLSISNSDKKDKLVLNLQGRGYFKP